MKAQEVIAHPKTEEQFEALTAFMKALKIKFKVAKEEVYDPEFVAKIEKARQDYKEGKGKVFTSEQLNALWK
jgi:nitrogen regulatory protein PII